MNHAPFYALAKRLNMDADGRTDIIRLYSEGTTGSLRELAESMPEAYNLMVRSMRSTVSPPVKQSDSDELDKMRKRCIAAIAAWLDSTGCKPINRLPYIRQTACRSAGKDATNFNTLTASQLRNVYNAFCRQNEAMERARQLKQVINPNPN